MSDQLITIFSKPNRYIVGSVALFILAIGGIVILVLNRGFNFADYNVTYTIQFSDEIDPTVVDGFSAQQYVSQLNRDSRSVDFQGIPEEELNQRFSSLKETYGEEQVSLLVTSRVLPQDLLTRFVVLGVASLVSFLGFIYYSIWRKLSSRRLMFSTLGLYTGAMLLGLVIHLGILSLASFVYELRDISFAGILGSGVIGGSLIYLLQHRSSSVDANGMSEVVTENELWLSSISRSILAIMLVLLAFLTLGLGNRFLVDAVILWFGVAVVVYSIKYVPSFVVDLSDGVLSRARYAVVEKDPDPTRVGDEYADIERISDDRTFGDGKSALKKKKSRKRRRV